MSSIRTLAAALEEALEDLKDYDLRKFCGRLRGRPAGPKIPRSRLEDKSPVEVADAMVSAFTEQEAVRVAVEVLAGMGCKDEARNLETAAGQISPASGSAGSAQDPHFVDKNHLELINRVTCVEPVLDELLHRGVIQQECYDTIRSLRPRQAQMRELFSGPLTAGRGAKDIFYEILQKQQKPLVDDLNGV